MVEKEIRPSVWYHKLLLVTLVRAADRPSGASWHCPSETSVERGSIESIVIQTEPMAIVWERIGSLHA